LHPPDEAVDDGKERLEFFVRRVDTDPIHRQEARVREIIDGTLRFGPEVIAWPDH
jgi:hypothetical protein